MRDRYEIVNRENEFILGLIMTKAMFSAWDPLRLLLSEKYETQGQVIQNVVTS